MLSHGDLPLRVVDRAAYFDFLGPQDEPWLRVLLEELARFEGRRRRELVERLAEPLPCEAPHFKRRAATRVLLRLWRRERVATVAPAEVRARLFGAAALPAPFGGPTRGALLDEIARSFGLDAAALAEALFADLPGERVVRAPEPPPTPAEVILRTNLAVVQTALMRASTIDLSVEGGVRPIVRLAKLRGLLCVAAEPEDGGAGHLQLSGPFSLFRHTVLYGRALAELVPHLAWCARFQLRAACSLWGRLVDVVVDNGAPIFPAAPPAPFDSQLEQRFARDFARLAPDWDLVREPEAVRAGATLVFPDFLLRHRLHPERRVLVELAGFWTPDYLAKKLAHLRDAAPGAPFLLCVDADRACAFADGPLHLSVLPYRRRVDAAAVLRRAQELTGGLTGDASLPQVATGATLGT